MAVPQEKELARPVPLTTGADGGIRLTGTRVTLDTVVAAFEEGATPEESPSNIRRLYWLIFTWSWGIIWGSAKPWPLIFVNGRKPAGLCVRKMKSVFRRLTFANGFWFVEERPFISRWADLLYSQ